MPDVYSTIAEIDPEMQERLAGILELRAADPQQQTFVRSYLADIEFPGHAQVLEIGCGTGAITRVLAQWPGVAAVVGVDPSPVFVATARELGADLPNATFVEADGRALPDWGHDFDVVIFHTALTHIPEPERALAEAFRVLRAGGTLASFDGDYSTVSEAIGVNDPIQSCVEAFKAAFINDVWLVRKLPTLLRATGFEIVGARSHGYLQTDRPEYMVTLVDRGADSIAAAGVIGANLCDALKSEARRRIEAGTFYGFINFTSTIARKPA